VGAAYREETMRRLVTLALAAGMAALVAAAAVDALRGSPETQIADSEPAETETEPPPSPADWVEDGPAIAARLARLGVTGTLYLSARGCLSGGVEPLRAVRLPELALAEGPEIGSCAFSLSADARHAAGRDAVWSPAAPVLAAETGTGVVLIDADTEAEWELPGRAPAFTPDGSLSVVDGGAIVTWSNDCDGAAETVSPAFSLVPGEPGPYCRRVAIRRAALGQRLPPQARLRRVVSQAWITDRALTALLDTTTGARIATYEDGRAVTVSPFDSPLGPMRAQPGGVNVGVLDRLNLLVYDIQPLPLFGTSLATLAYDWSPRGDWLAYATNGAVYLVRTSDWTTQVRIRVSTQGLAWR
jgi:hypothetical protein